MAWSKDGLRGLAEALELFNAQLQKAIEASTLEAVDRVQTLAKAHAYAGQKKGASDGLESAADD